MIFMILFYSLANLPLTTAPTTRSQVRSIRNITMKNRASMLGMLVAGAGNCFLFSSIKAGGIEKPMRFLTWVVLAVIIFVMSGAHRHHPLPEREAQAGGRELHPSSLTSTTSTPKSKSRNTDDTKTCSRPWRGGVSFN